MNILNILLNFLLINPVRTTRIGPLTVTIWGAGWGVAGAAIATAIAYVVGGTLMFLGLWHNPILAVRRQRVRLDRPVMRQCVWVGLPIAGERVITCLGQVLFTALIARLGTVAIAAHSIAITAEQAFYIPGYGMQAAAATLSGHAAGEGNEKKLMQYSSAITVIAVGLMSALSVLLFFFPM